MTIQIQAIPHLNVTLDEDFLQNIVLLMAVFSLTTIVKMTADVDRFYTFALAYSAYVYGNNITKVVLINF